MTNLSCSWQRTWKALGANTDGIYLYKELLDRYSEPQRKYHTLQHLAECIAWFELVKDFASKPPEVEAALWFHDSIYEVMQKNNEELSSQWARDSLLEAKVSTACVARIQSLVLATKHTKLSSSPDEQLIIDIDLAILGSAPLRFAEYEQQIRQEYAHVPEDIFQQKRQKILRSFLDRDRIYSTEFFYLVLEQQARTNLQHTLAMSKKYD